MPKQFIDDLINLPQSQGSLFQSALSRLDGLDELGDPVIVCNEDYRFLVAEQLLQLGKSHSTLLLEPVARNTAPAVALAALSAQQDYADPVLLVLPADHLIKNRAALQEAISRGIDLAQRNYLVTFGIVPGAPETGYGYIEKGQELRDGSAHKVASFVEKPDMGTAEAYLASGSYFWNSGIFMFTASRYLQELKRYAPDIFESCHAAYAELDRGDDFHFIPRSLFEDCRSESVDCAVMERTDSAAVIQLDADWNDLGAWDAMWEVANKDSAGNVIGGDVVTEAVKNSYIQSHSRLVAAVGMENTVIVETADAVLVASLDKVQSVKKIVAQLEAKGRAESINHSRAHRPWGYFELLGRGQGYQVEHMLVNPGASLSLQSHKHRSEHWTVIAGTGLVTCDNREFLLHCNESTFIPVGSKHRISNPGTEAVEIIEVQLGDYLGEDDIVRFEDKYGRV